MTVALALISAAWICTGDELSPIKIVSISEVPDPHSIAYPDAATVCLCLDPRREKILVTLPAFRQRKLLNEFADLKTGSVIKVKLTPWIQRPEESQGMFIANDFADLFDLILFWGSYSKTLPVIEDKPRNPE